MATQAHAGERGHYRSVKLDGVFFLFGRASAQQQMCVVCAFRELGGSQSTDLEFEMVLLLEKREGRAVRKVQQVLTFNCLISGPARGWRSCHVLDSLRTSDYQP